MEQPLNKQINLALISPNQTAYSETFIDAHKKFLVGNIKLYYAGFFPTLLEGYGAINAVENIASLKVFFLKNILRRQYNWPQYHLAKSFISQKINCVFAEYGPTGAEVLPVCKSLALPLIVHFHGFDASHAPTLELYRSNYQQMFDYAKAVVVVSRVMEKKLVELGCPPEKIVYNVYGPQEVFFEVVPKAKKKQFLAVGRFVDKKAPYYSILAFRKVLEKHPDAKLVMGGQGELLNACKNLASYFNISDSISFPGVLSQNEIINYMAESIAFVQHSITAGDGDMEGSPVAILEAQAASLPVIATRHAGIPEIVEDKITGLLCNEHEVDSMAVNMLFLLDNPEVALEMGTKGRKNIKENFTLTAHILKLNNLINGAV